MGEVTHFTSTGYGGILDLYTPIIGGDEVQSSSVPRWLLKDHWRRIKAYEYLEQLYSNADAPPDSQLDMSVVRLGTIAYIIQLIRDLTVGGEQRITVAGAETSGGDSTKQAQQIKFQEWARRNKVYPKIQEGERLCGLLGDVFYRLRIGKTRRKNDVKLDVIHPSFAYPVYDADDELTDIALIWEENRIVNGLETQCVYKDEYHIGEDGLVRETAGWYNYSSFPLSSANVGFAGLLSDLKLDEYDATVDGDEITNLNLGIDRIPIYHLPNFWTAANYGESDIAYVTHEAAELNATDTDMAAAATLLGVPPLVVAGLKGRIRKGVLQDTEEASVGPGKVFSVDTNGGKAEYLDNSNLLKCLIEYSERMEFKLFRNTRLGKLFSGQTDNLRDIESSKALKTMMASLYARISQKRTVRSVFYADLLTGVRELLLKLDKSESYPETNMSLEFGNVLPSDNSDDLKVVSDVWAQGKGPISAETAVRMAQRAGSGVVDCNREALEVTKQVQPPAKPASFSLATPGPGTKTPPGVKAPAPKA